MTMTIRVKTESGADYIFTQKDGKTFFQRDFMLSGEVVKLHNEMEAGGKIRMDFFKEKTSGVLQEELSYLESSQIVKIVIC